MLGMRMLENQRLTLALSGLLILAGAALALPAGVIPITDVLGPGPGSPPGDRTDYVVNTGGEWDEYPAYYLMPSAAAIICVTFLNDTGETLHLQEIGFSAKGEPESSFMCGIYTDVGAMEPPPDEMPDFFTLYSPLSNWSPYVSIDLEGAGLYIPDGNFFSFYYQVPETGGGLFDANIYQGWFSENGENPEWTSLATYSVGYSPAFQFRAESVTEFTVCPEGGEDFTDIQSAVDAASDGFTIWLCDGLYTGSGNSLIDCQGKDLTIRSISDNPENCTIVLGPPRGRKPDRPQSWGSSDSRGSGSRNWDRDRIPPEDNFAFVYQNGETSAAELRGVTIQGGEASVGGGIQIYGSSPTIRNCRFIDNTAETYGGGVYCVFSESEFSDCIFTGNFVKQFDTQEGGGGLLIAMSNVSVTNCVFIENTAPFGGGVAVYDQSIVTLPGCIFLDNISIDGGGAYVDEATLTLPGCSFVNNIAYDSGGGLFSNLSTVDVSDTQYEGNVGSFGGALAFRASLALVEDCLIRDNNALFGGGVLAESGPPYRDEGIDIVNCTIVENVADDGAGVFFDFVDMTLNSSILAFNINGSGIDCISGCTPSIICTDIFGNTGGNWEELWLIGLLGVGGNIEEDPQFCGDVGTGNCELQSDSPCMPGGNDCGVIIGALGQGCGPQAARSMNWGQVKALY